MAADFDSPDEQLLIGLAKLGLALRHEAWQSAAPRGLTPTQAQAVVCLERGASRRLGELARELGVTDATASDAVRVLVEKGLVRKERDDDDARALRLVLTPAGRREARRAGQWPDAFLLGAADLSTEERGVLLRGLSKIIRRLQLEGRIPVARMCASCAYFRPHAHRDAMRPHHCAFVDAAFGEHELRLECPDHVAAAPEESDTRWRHFVAGGTRPSSRTP